MGNGRSQDTCHTNGREPITPGGSIWMAGLKNAISLARLTIPGTHNSGAYRGGAGGAIGALFVQCQVWDIRQQLQAGVRYLDVRCRHIGNGFTIHHGEAYMHLSFGQVMNAVCTFLNEHPTEAVFVQMKQEHTEERTTRSFHDTAVAELNRFEGHWAKVTQVPTLGEVRGKFMVVQGFGGPNVGAIPLNHCSIQDAFDISREDKKNRFVDHAKFALNGPMDRLFLNYTTLNPGQGYGGIWNICDLAVEANWFLHENMPPGPQGVVLMDYPGPKLLRKLIDQN